MKIYLCGPINGCSDSEAMGWRESVKSHFPSAIDPMRRDYRGIEQDNYREIVELDKKDIRDSDALLVMYDKPSVGTSMEVFYAWSIGKPVYTVATAGARVSPWLRYHSTAIVDSMDEAISRIRFALYASS